MMGSVFHYIHDPLCGWCYAAERLVEAVAHVAPAVLSIQLYGGGLFPRTSLSAAKREHIGYFCPTPENVKSASMAFRQHSCNFVR